MQKSGPRLPPEPADRFTKPFARFLRIESAAGGVLLLATLAALILSNSPWSTSFLALWETEVGLHIGTWTFARSLRHWINDGLITIFFFVVALELKREFVLGELRSLRMAALSLGGALGGMIVPASLYLALMAGEPGVHGWGTVMATDTAFVIGCLALLGRRIPASLRLFLLSLAIFDDIGRDPGGRSRLRRLPELAGAGARRRRPCRPCTVRPHRDQKRPVLLRAWGPGLALLRLLRHSSHG